MYAVRGSWAGQTFALATSNDSGEKKSRIRRSKKERKAMAETFIKRYQSFNEGNFPSLSLTHKEVGGSFYTVREIVREIIQENKVLGPAKSSSEERKDDTTAKHHPSGSICAEPQSFLFQNDAVINVDSNRQEHVERTLESNGHYMSQENLDPAQCSSEHQSGDLGEDPNVLACRKSKKEDFVTSSHHKHQTLELSLSSCRQYPDEVEMENKQNVNGFQNGISEESNTLFDKKSPMREDIGADGISEQIGALKADVTFPTEEVEVETFPLRPTIKEIDGMGTTSNDLGDNNGTLNDLETMQIALSNAAPILDRITSPDWADSVKVSQHAPVNGAFIHSREVDLTRKALEMPDPSARREGNSLVTHDHASHVASQSDLTVKSTGSAELGTLQTVEATIAPNGATSPERNLGTSSNSARKEPVVEAVNGDDIRIDKQFTIGSSPTLDRINLESWSGSSRQDTNPLLAFIKAFVDAFTKFWSE